MAVMAKKKADRHQTRPFPLRLRADLKEQLEKLAERNVTSITAEIIAAVRDRLIANGLWPPPTQ